MKNGELRKTPKILSQLDGWWCQFNPGETGRIVGLRVLGKMNSLAKHVESEVYEEPTGEDHFKECRAQGRSLSSSSGLLLQFQRFQHPG